MRSVVLHGSVRCPGCQLPPRWCVCAARETVACPLAVDVLSHHRERFRPSSTGNLIERVLPDARRHEWRRERGLQAADVARPGRELWILHPHGPPVPADARPEGVQILLLDGSWREATTMAHEVRDWGRTYSLPMTGESRFWLRAQAAPGRFSTVEALLFLLARLGLTREERALRLQFELHVYASLRSRGRLDPAAAYLATSPIRDAYAPFLAQLHEPRPREDDRPRAR